MKKTATLLTAAMLLMLSSFQGTAQCYPEGKTAADIIRENPAMGGNNHHSYIYIAEDDTKAPKGYKPFYISHYGRHGSRDDYMGEAWARVVDALKPAHEQGLLTEKGEKAYAAAIEMTEKSVGMREMLTPRGAKEHAEIAARMYDRFPDVFKGSRTVEARSSTVQRCILSMGAFTTSLAAKAPQLKFDMLTGETYYAYIAGTKGYHGATAGFDKMYSSYKKAQQRDTTSIIAAMFKDAAVGRSMIKDVRHFQDDMVTSCSYCTCFDVTDDFGPCIPFQESYNAWSLKNHSLYMQHCNSVEFGDRRIPIARALVGDILTKADAAVAGNDDRAADLRFGHDYPIMALAGYLNLEGIGDRYTFDQVDQNWFGTYYICMGTNLQLVFYRNKKGDVLVKCLWNERETGINGLKPVSGPYYRWSEVREYWANRYPADKYPVIEEDDRPAPGMPGGQKPEGPRPDGPKPDGQMPPKR